MSVSERESAQGKLKGDVLAGQRASQRVAWTAVQMVALMVGLKVDE